MVRQQFAKLRPRKGSCGFDPHILRHVARERRGSATRCGKVTPSWRSTQKRLRSPEAFLILSLASDVART